MSLLEPVATAAPSAAQQDNTGYLNLRSLLSWITRIKSDSAEASSDRYHPFDSPSPADHRRYIRSPIKCGVQIGVQDASGRQFTLECRNVDLSNAGATVLCPAAIIVGAVVSFQCKQLQLMGAATVRRCTARKSKFLIGLEFRGTLMRTY